MIKDKMRKAEFVLKLISNESGFSFLEMCMVVAIIGILLMVAVPNYQKAVATSQNKICDANKKMIESEVESYYIDNNKYPPVDDSGTTDNETIKELVTAGYLKEDPKCPSGGKYSITMDATTQTVTATCNVHTK